MGMETYGSRLRNAARSVMDRVLRRDVARSRETISYDEARRLLEETDEVRVTRLPTGLTPATTHRIEGEEAAAAWTRLTDVYTLHEPVLKTTCRGGECVYAIDTRYDRDGWYGGEYRFEVDEDAFRATFGG